MSELKLTTTDERLLTDSEVIAADLDVRSALRQVADEFGRFQDACARGTHGLWFADVVDLTKWKWWLDNVTYKAKSQTVAGEGGGK